MQVKQIRCADIRPDPRGDRYRMHEIEPLADSIRLLGVLRPVLLCEAADSYVIVHGERRWQAARLVGLESIPAIIVMDLTRDAGVAASHRPAGPVPLRPLRAAVSDRYEVETIED